MQHTPPEIKDRLLKALDSEYNVVDMGAVLEVITILERTHMTKESLEITRLGKHINEFRRKTNNEVLAKRAKDLLRRWRGMIMPPGGGAAPVTSTPPLEPLATLNGSNSTNITGPGPGGTHRSCRSTLTSPAMSTASSSGSPSLRRLGSVPSSPQPSRTASPRLEPVGRTHASNKRLRKENVEEAAASGPPPTKQQRLNGCCTKESASTSPLVPNLDLVKKSKHSASSSASSSAENPTLPPPPASTSSLVADTDIVKAKMMQIGRRVKTTQELLEELKHREGGATPAAPSSDADDFRRSKTEHLAKFLNSQPEVAVKLPKVAPTVVPAGGPGSPTTRTVAEILASLPPIDPSVLLNDSDDEERVPSAPTEELLERVLAGDPVEGVTGNMEEEGDGPKTEHAFREWHESVWRRSYDGQPLFVWPYVITD